MQTLRKNRLYKIYQEVNDFEGVEWDKTYLKGSNQLDAVFGTE